MSHDDAGGARASTPPAALSRDPDRLLAVSDDSGWVGRLAAAFDGPTVTVPSERADSPCADLDGYPGAVVVDGESPVDATTAFEAVRERHPDAACLLAGGGAHVTDADRPVVLEYLPNREPAAVAAAAEHALETRTHRGYPVADREDDRLAAARRLADPRAGGAGLDALAAATARALEADNAHVAVLGDHRLRVLATSDDRLPGAVERARTVTTYAVLDSGVTVVPDLAADPRFRETSTALAAGFRGYAGVPVRVEGRAVGALGVLRESPYIPDDDAEATLSHLATVAADLFAVGGGLADAAGPPEPVSGPEPAPDSARE